MPRAGIYQRWAKNVPAVDEKFSYKTCQFYFFCEIKLTSPEKYVNISKQLDFQLKFEQTPKKLQYHELALYEASV